MSERIDITLNFLLECPGKDPDTHSPTLRRYHQLLWSKPLGSGTLFELVTPRRKADGYLTFDGPNGLMYFGSDAITNSYTRWLRPRRLVEAMEGLDPEQRLRFLDPPYRVGSAMIWPVRSTSRPTINQARGTRAKIADRMDLTLECIRRHYAGTGEWSPLQDVLSSYADFFDLFDGFREFVAFFHFQDLVSPDYSHVRFLIPFDGFDRPGVPSTLEEYVECREATLTFEAARGRRMAASLACA